MTAMPDPTFEKYDTKDLAAWPPGKRFLDRHGTVWTKRRSPTGKDYWQAVLLSTGKAPTSSNKFRTNCDMSARMLSHYTGDLPKAINTARKEQ